MNKNTSCNDEGVVYFAPLQFFALAAAVAGTLAVFALPANAQVAQDSAANYTTATWTNGANAGSGFNPWTLNITPGTGNAGVFIGDPSSAGISGMNAQSFGFYANPAGSGANAGVSRSLAAPLEAGQTFSFQWGLNWDSDAVGSNRGFNLLSGGTQLFNINMGNSSAITINNTAMFSEFGSQAFVLNFEQVSPTSIRVYGTGRNGVETYDNTFTGLAGAADNFAFYYNAAPVPGAPNQDYRQMYMNNLSVVPEPSVVSLFLAGVAGIAYSVRRRWRTAKN
jgi:hypothetical protein